jgi:Asp-tRNA(Asn)/Glu-tRNA(Gln) amidotransferase A subunit family amidase
MAENGEVATISDFAPLIRRKEISPIELTRLYLESVARLNPLLNAYITVDLRVKVWVIFEAMYG